MPASGIPFRKEDVDNQLNSEEAKGRYASPMIRYGAALVDTMILFALLLGSGAILGKIEMVPDSIRFLALLGLLFSYDPILVSTTKGTIGHHFFGLKVVGRDGNSRISLHWAALRFLLKGFLGIISFFWIFGEKRQTLHDIATRSQVIHK